MNVRRVFPLAILMWFVLAATAFATVVDEVAKDFKPLSGYVIMPAQGEYLIDKDASSGVSVGDLFSVVKPGEKVIHPVTKEVLGSLDEVKGVLQVTRVKSGYSYARPVGEAKGIERGDVVRRYENVSAAFWDYTGRGEAFFSDLKAALPNLEWQDFAAAQADRPQTPAPTAAGGPELVFVLSNEGLEVHGADFRTLHAYSPPDAITALPSVAPAPLPAPAVIPGPGQAGLEARLQALEQRLEGEPAGQSAPYRLEKQAEGSRGSAYEAAFPGFNKVGDLPESVKMADFVRDGDRLLMATTDSAEIKVYAIGDALQLIAEGDTDIPGKILALRWWRPATNGPLYLAVTMSADENAAYNPYMGQRISSALFELAGGNLTLVRGGLSYLLGAFDRDGDGQRETLLGQEFDRDVFFGHRMYELRLKDGDVEKVEPTFGIPKVFPVQGSLFADLTGDGRPETIYIRNRILYVYDGKKKLYESSKQMGGSLSAMTYSLNPDAADQITSTATFEVPPVAVDLDGDGRLELVAVASEGSFKVPGIGPGIEKSWLMVLKFRNGMFVRGTLGEELENPVQGLTVTGDRALVVISATGGLLGDQGESHLLAFPLK